MHPVEFQKALEEIYTRGYYNADASNVNFRRLIIAEQKKELFNLSERERQFLQYACSDMTYKKIASLMGVTERSVDSCRETLFQSVWRNVSWFVQTHEPDPPDWPPP